MTASVHAVIALFCLVIIGHSTADEQSYAACCNAGEKKADQDRSCRRIEQFLDDWFTLKTDHQCLNAARKCCRNEIVQSNCDSGILQAMNDLKCEDLRSARAEECCTVCYEGLNSKHCSASWLDDDPLAMASFEKCCKHRNGNTRPMELIRQKRMNMAITCPPGSILNETTCQDLDECHGLPCPNGYKCVNRHEGYECVTMIEALDDNEIPPLCSKGFIYSSHLRHCIDRDECAEQLGQCPSNEVCMNTIGGFLCSPIWERRCETGYTFVENQGCVDINECDSKQCFRKEICVDRNGHSICVSPCKIGQKIDPVKLECVDDDECQTGNQTCKSTALCVNTNTGFKCKMEVQSKSCHQGYELDKKGMCIDIDECKQPSNPCGDEAQCVNTVGSFACHRNCGVGYEHVNGSCIDIDECSDGNQPCKPGQRCENLSGSYRCLDEDCELLNKVKAPDGTCLIKRSCLRGYHHDVTLDQCVDTDECKQRSICPANTECKNVPGGFSCVLRPLVQCRLGMQRTPDGLQCLNINECEKGLDNCDSETEICIDTIGNFTCHCKEGFRRNREGICTLLPCQPGYRRVNATHCQDIDECIEQQLSSKPLCDQICLNTPGSYECACHEGYTAVANGKCRRPTECEPQNCGGICEYSNGMMRCVCPKGFDKKGTDCVDINECRLGTHNCSSSSSCLNIEGGFRCTELSCPPEYREDKKHMRCLRTSPCPDCPDVINNLHVSLQPSRRKPIKVKLSYNSKTEVKFSYEIQDVQHGTAVQPATRDNFSLEINKASAKIVLRKPLQGPQDVHLILTAKIYHKKAGQLTGERKAFKMIVWKIILNVPGHI